MISSCSILLVCRSVVLLYLTDFSRSRDYCKFAVVQFSVVTATS